MRRSILLSLRRRKGPRGRSDLLVSLTIHSLFWSGSTLSIKQLLYLVKAIDLFRIFEHWLPIFKDRCVVASVIGGDFTAIAVNKFRHVDG